MNILICDDEPEIVEHIAQVVKKEFQEFQLFKAHNSKEFNEIINFVDKIDLFFADIMLGDENGISLAKLAAERYPDIQTVFVSGNTDMMPATFEAGDNVRFIRKPIDDFYIRYHIESAVKAKETKKDILTFNIGKKTISFDVSKLVYIESRRNSVYIFLTDETIKLTAKLSDFEPLMSNKLIRCHQSFIVNIMFISSFGGNELKTATGVSIPISYSRLQETKEKYFMFKGGLL